MTVRLWIRADASASIGLGHLMRTLAVAEVAKARGIDTCFLIGGDETAVTSVARRGFDAVHVGSGETWFEALSADDLFLFDGYGFGPDLMAAVRKRVARVGAVDDLGHGRFPVDVLLNQNPLTETAYELPDRCTRLIGPHYALVRGEFLRHRRDRSRDDPRTLLVATGGSDVADLASTSIELWPQREAFQSLVVVKGPAAPELDAKVLPPGVTVAYAPNDLAGTFASADAAISAAGSTTWELLTLGLPTALITVAANQGPTGPGVEREAAGLYLGAPAELRHRFAEVTRWLADPQERATASQNALRLIDGRGAARFLDVLTLGTTRR